MAYPSMRSERCSKIYVRSAMSLTQAQDQGHIFSLIFSAGFDFNKICLFQSTTESDTHSELTGVSEGQENLEN